MIDHIERKRMFQAVAGYRASTANRWLTCLAASRIVGSRKTGATREVAAALGLEASQIENLARAGLLYRYLRRYGAEIQQARYKLTVSHWVAAADVWRREEPDPKDLFDTLVEASSEEVIPSVSQFRSLLEGLYGKVEKMEWEKKLNSAVNKLKNMLNDYGLPDDIRQKASQFVDLLQADEVREIVIRGHHPVSWNHIWSNHHWSIRRQVAINARAAVRAELDPNQPPMKVPVVIEIDVYFDKHPQDSDNIMAKPFIDGLKGWWIPDDKPEVVKWVRVSSLIDKNDPRIVIRAASLPGAVEWEKEDDIIYEEYGEV